MHVVSTAFDRAALAQRGLHANRSDASDCLRRMPPAGGRLIPPRATRDRCARERALKRRACVLMPTLKVLAFGEPTATGQERALLSLAVGARAPHQSVLDEIALNRRDGAGHALVARGQKPDHRQEAVELASKD